MREESKRPPRRLPVFLHTLERGLRDWKNWFFPLSTCLIVLGLALLPLRLSLLEDGKRTGVVHSEELGEDSNFPARSPDLPERIWLLAQRESTPESLAIMDQELEGGALEDAAAQARTELGRLEEAGVLPRGLSDRLEVFSGNRVYLRNITDLSSAAFWEINGFEASGGGYCWLYLDAESGKILGLELSSHLLVKQPVEPISAGQAFLEVLGLNWEERGYGGNEAAFLLTGGQTLYWCVCDKGYLRLFPSVDWEALDKVSQSGVSISAAARSAPGYDA